MPLRRLCWVLHSPQQPHHQHMQRQPQPQGRQARLQQASQHRPGLALLHLLRQKRAHKQEGLARQLCHLKLEWLMHLSHYQVFCGRASRVCRTLQASLQLSLPHCLRPSRSAAPSLLCCC